MTEKQFTVEDIEDMIYQLGLPLWKKIFLKNIKNLTQ